MTADAPVIAVAGGWDTVFDGNARAELERDALPAFVRRQRWFGGKARGLRSVRVADWGRLPAGDGFAVVVEVELGDGGRDRYFVPLAVDPAGTLGEVVARLTGPDGDAVLTDAAGDVGFCTLLLAAVEACRTFPTGEGSIRAVSTAAFPRLCGNPADAVPVRLAPATSSNSIVFFGDRLLMKVFRRLEAGTNPDVEVGRFLTETGRFDRTPGLAGWIEYHAPNGETYTIGLVQAAVPNRGDGWTDALAALGDYYGRVSGASTVPEAVGDYLRSAATLGRRTAEMHLALASDAGDPAFALEPLTAADLDGLSAEIVGQARRVLAALADAPPAVRHLLDGGGRDSSPVPDAVKTRIHGDYHLGQVLCVGDDFVVIDFEGEPTRSVAERRAKCSPVRDVAGMLRSYHYAAYAGLFAATEGRPEEAARLEPWAEAWHRGVSAAFLREYLATAGDAAFVPRSADDFARLLNGYSLAKSLYELVYELNNRPGWVRIPLSGVTAMLTQSPQGGDNP